MADTTLTAIVDRIALVCEAEPFTWLRSPEPDTFDRQPAEAMVDGAYRLEAEATSATGISGMAETRIDTVVIEVARLHGGNPVAVERQLQTDGRALVSALMRDGYDGGGDYHVADAGRSSRVTHEPGRAYSVLRLILPVDYEAAL